MKESVKKIVRERAKFCCEYCLAQSLFSADIFSIEHIIPISKGDTSVISNLAYSCQCCNNHKFTATHVIDPATGHIVSLFNPRTDSWATHFEWHENFTKIRGISPTGRATVKRLKLNREGLINLRQLLFQVNKHPPY